MYAVVKTGGKQYKVEQGLVLRFEKIPGEVGSPVRFDQVLIFGDGGDVQIGQPLLENVAVEGHIVEQGKSRKILVFKYKRRKRFRRKQGHRQQYTAVQIDNIGPKISDAPKKPEPKTEAGAPETEKAETGKKAAPKRNTPKKTGDKAGAKKTKAGESELKAE
jgi:large subunit ribosomal protein L21